MTKSEGGPPAHVCQNFSEMADRDGDGDGVNGDGTEAKLDLVGNELTTRPRCSFALVIAHCTGDYLFLPLPIASSGAADALVPAKSEQIAVWVLILS